MAHRDRIVTGYFYHCDAVVARSACAVMAVFNSCFDLRFAVNIGAHISSLARSVDDQRF